MIYCREAKNNSCVKCHKTPKNIISIGSIHMCYDCWKEEFKAVDKFPAKMDNNYYNIYKFWVNIKKSKNVTI